MFTERNNVEVVVEVDRHTYSGNLPVLFFRVNSTVMQTFAPREGAVQEYVLTITDLPDGQWQLSVGYDDPPYVTAINDFVVRIFVRNMIIKEWPEVLEPRRQESAACMQSGVCTDVSFSSQDRESLKLCKSKNFERRNQPARIFDGFSFHDEIDILEVLSLCEAFQVACTLACDVLELILGHHFPAGAAV